MSTEPIDAQIAQLLKRGDAEKAFNLLIGVHARQLQHLCLASLREPAVAKDAYQGTLFRIWQFLPSYDARRGTLVAWIRAIARNQCSTERSRQSGFFPLPEDFEDCVDADRSMEETDPQALVMKQSDIEQLRAMVRQLPERSRRVLHLFYYEDHSVREIARILECNTATVRTWLRRARIHLQKKLNDRDMRTNARVEAAR